MKRGMGGTRRRMAAFAASRTLRRSVITTGAVIAAGAVYAVGPTAHPSQANGHLAIEAPIFEVDPFWPLPLPNHWLFGSVVGVAVDERDHVYVLNRRDSFNPRTEIGAATDPPTGDCCLPAPAVLVFDPAGALAAHWDGAGDGYDWSAAYHRLGIDASGTVWIGAVGEHDAQILRFARDGRFAGQLGRAAAGPAPGAAFQRVAKVSFDAAAGVAYVADGSRRVIVIDPATGAVHAAWSAYGGAHAAEAPPAYDPAQPPARQFRNVQCAEPSADGLIYVCDRESNRIQVFRRDGTFVNEVIVAPRTLGTGSVWDIAFSRDPRQRFLYVADGANARIHVLDRAALEVLTSFGTGGRQPGQFHAVHSIATDSHGNLYTGETLQGKRVQKFVFRGIGQVEREQGTLWPARR
jgi:DNA-binding beta-propeller fold protein YncE